MIQIKPAAAVSQSMTGQTVTVWLRPNRTLSRRSMHRLVGWLAVATLGTALLGAWVQGNIYAPLFALAESAGVAWALGVAWHAGDRSERITMDAHTLQVEALPGGVRTRFQPGWVRVRLQPGSGHRRLLLASHGRELEIGAFLADEERVEVSRELNSLLARMNAPWHRQSHP